MFAKKTNIIKCSEFKDGLCPSLFRAFLIQENPQKNAKCHLKLCRRHRRELMRLPDSRLLLIFSLKVSITLQNSAENMH